MDLERPESEPTRYRRLSVSRPWTASVGFLVVGLLVGGITWYASVAEPRRAILLLLDAARADRFSCYGYPIETTPEIDRLAHQGILFLNHYSQETSTRASLPQILFSRYFIKALFPNSPNVPFSAPDDLFREMDPESGSLPRALSEAGFHTAAVSAHTWLKPDVSLAKEFDEFHDLASNRKPSPRSYPRASEVVDSVIDWIRNHEEKDFFLYVHLMDSHIPHFFDQAARELWESAVRGQPSYRKFDAMYDADLQHADRELGRLFSYLRSREMFEDTLIAIASDHGEHIDDRFWHGGPWTEDVARVPFILSYPAKVTPGVETGFTENVDIMPTLLGLLDVDVPEGKAMDGIALLESPSSGRGRDTAYARRGIRSRKHKAVFDQEIALGSEGDLTGRLYDLEADPGEKTDIRAQLPEVWRDLAKLYQDKMLPLYRRYDAAVSQSTPESAFAIAANYFELSGERGDRSWRRGWRKKQHWSDSEVTAQAGAPAVDLGFRVPNGTYHVSASFVGSARFIVGDLEGNLRSVNRKDVRDMGRVSISDERFQVRLWPEDGAGFSLFYVGFVPVGKAVVDEAVEKSLKALGYIQ